MDGDLNFFKVITTRVRAEGRLQLPPGCRERMEAFSNNVTLRDQYKDTWTVEIAKYGGDWYFTKGWMECSNANMLEAGDMILFDYKGNAVFDFKIIGSNECDKERVRGPVKDEEMEQDGDDEEMVKGPAYIVKDEEVEQDGDDEEMVKGPAFIVKDEEAEKDDDEEEMVRGPSFIVKDEEVELDGEEERENIDGIKQVVEEDTETDDTYEMDSSEDDYAEEESDDSTEDESADSIEDSVQVKEESEEEEDYTPKKAGKSKAKRKACEQPGSSATQLGVGTMPQRRKYRSRSGSNCYGSDIFKSGLISRPKNPFFVTRSRPASRGNELNIPSEVIKDFKLSIPVNFHLVDEKGLKWGTTIKQWGDGRVWCVRGWDALCERNGIEKDDACVCEFVQGEGDDNFCIKVQRVRDPRK